MAHEGSLTYYLLSDREFQQIWTLAQLPFTLDEWYPLWQRWGWPYQPEPDDEFGFTFELVASVFGVAGRREGGRFPLCIFRFCSWEGWNPADQANPAAYSAEQAHYDELFHIHRTRAESLYGTPQHTLVDTTDTLMPLRAVIWQTPLSLCILQQSAIDIQYGYELHFWLESFTEAQFVPPASLDAWLEDRHRPV
jgi:hypothetical protein